MTDSSMTLHNEQIRLNNVNNVLCFRKIPPPPKKKKKKKKLF